VLTASLVTVIVLQMVSAQEQLVVAQKMEAIGRLAGGIAHDFNNLLTVITGRATLLEAGLPADGRLRRHAGLILSTADRAGALTRQLLAFGRRQVLQPKVIQLNEVVTAMGAMLRPRRATAWRRCRCGRRIARRSTSCSRTSSCRA
jgi:signal transduction histidine kinase